MISIILKLLICAGIFYMASVVYPKKIIVKNGTTAILAAAIYGIMNALWGWFASSWLVQTITLPFKILTLGLWNLVVAFLFNALLLWVTEQIISGLTIKDLKSLFALALVFSIANFVLAIF